jgi:hypothetical protein
MTEQTVPEPTAFGAVVMDIALERGVGDPANLELPDDQHKALEDHMNGVRKRSHEDGDLCLSVALAFGIDPDEGPLATEHDRRDSMRLAMAYTFGELIAGKL